MHSQARGGKEPVVGAVGSFPTGLTCSSWCWEPLCGGTRGSLWQRGKGQSPFEDGGCPSDRVGPGAFPGAGCDVYRGGKGRDGSADGAGCSCTLGPIKRYHPKRSSPLAQRLIAIYPIPPKLFIAQAVTTIAPLFVMVGRAPPQASFLLRASERPRAPGQDAPAGPQPRPLFPAWRN